jgi:hypothetical protein
MTGTRENSIDREVKMECAFYDDRWSKNRTVMDCNWSPKVKLIIIDCS